MAYQRTEYADKTLSMNSLADRRLKLKLGSIESHKGTIEKELKREKKKVERELGVEDQLRNRLTVTDISGDSSRSLSPRLPRRYSTPPELLSASLPLPVTDPRRSPVATRRRFGSEGMNEPLSYDSSGNNALLSPTSMFLKAPFDQPRRQSLPPIGDGGLLSAESGHRRDRRGSYGGAMKSPILTPSPNISGASTPRRVLSRNNSSLNEAQMNEITAKVSKFLQKMDNKSQEETKAGKEPQERASERTEKQTENSFDSCHQDSFSLPAKSSSQVGTFQPLNFE
ncbi:uncharacterized protein LOC116300516 [Actinia tenebrosa]|uniref:Uncharacterized protein LOC116300516 n=1 Tax=Actinia tenebrosa TaxID=6105 RepID=A0A6P8IF43_ACTTE|nr:uncharacterized protein LOC116300516 [Actinia tenebrosa]